LRTGLPHVLKPGESAPLIAQLAAPFEPGRYILQWDLVIEFVSWFSDKGWHGPQLEIDVQASPDPMFEYLARSREIPGWIRDEEAKAFASLSYSLPDDATVVEIGSFLGSSAVILAGARKLRGSGQIHCIDPFDCSGDSFSVPVYEEVLKSAGIGALRAQFDENISRAKVTEWVKVHEGKEADVARTWTAPIDLLLLDGDQSRKRARQAYENWTRYLKPGGIIAVHNAADRIYADDHDGNRQLALEEIVPPQYTQIHQIGATTVATKTLPSL
jgi:MMP 1-O-methyltransferase